MLVVDDSHGHGVMGQTGRGTHEHCGLRSDQVTSSPARLGRRWVGGWWLCGRFANRDRSLGPAGRPHCSPMPCRPPWPEPRWRSKFCRKSQSGLSVFANVERARSGIRDAGFEVLESPTAICPIIGVIPPGPFVFRSGCLRRVFCDWLWVSRGPRG